MSINAEITTCVICHWPLGVTFKICEICVDFYFCWQCFLSHATTNEHAIDHPTITSIVNQLDNYGLNGQDDEDQEDGPIIIEPAELEPFDPELDPEPPTGQAVNNEDELEQLLEEVEMVFDDPNDEWDNAPPGPDVLQNGDADVHALIQAFLDFMLNPDVNFS